MTTANIPPDTGAAVARMPGEAQPHERTLMCWPAREEIWGRLRRRAEEDYAAVARAIARYEPVTMIAAPQHAEAAASRCGPQIEVVEIPIDDSWVRDSGPIYLVDDSGLVVLDPVFNGWGGRFHPHDRDAALASRWAELRGDRVRKVPMVLEGGAVSVDGAGTVVTTEQCLLNPNRNPDLDRSGVEAALRDALGVHTVVWLPFGLVLDRHTDGHVDNVAAFVRPGVVLAQGCDDPAEADHDRLAENRRRLDAVVGADGARLLDVVDIPVLPFAEISGERVVVPYLNLYVCNGAVIVPTCGHPADEEMLGLIGEVFADREVVSVPGEVLAFGGGGPHCITQQIPRVPGPDEAVTHSAQERAAVPAATGDQL